MNEVTTYRWSFEDDIGNYRTAGYQSVGLWRQKLIDYGQSRAVDLVDRSGLSISSLGWAGGFTGVDGRSFQECLEDTADALRLAADLQAGCLVVYPGGRNNHIFRHAYRLLRLALDELLPLAEAVEIPIALAPRHAACATDWTFLTDLDSVRELIDEFRTSYLQIAYETYHFGYDDAHWAELREAVPHVAIVHLADRCGEPNIDHECCLLGHGQLPLEEIVATIRECGYKGAFDVKLAGPEIEAGDYWCVLEHSRQAFAELARGPVVPKFA